MITVHKFPIPVARRDTFSLRMPAGAEPIHFAEDPLGNLAVWARVNTDQPLFSHVFRIAGTGHPIDDTHGWEHVGTTISGPFLWHLFHRPGVAAPAA